MMKHAFVFPGQGAQFPGMGKQQYEGNAFAKKLFEQGNELLGFRISDVMFGGSAEELKQTNITQPAIFLHSVIAFKCIDGARPDMVAGHSLGEFSALVANGTLRFEDGLMLVSLRAAAMQEACELVPSSMAAVLGLPDNKVEEVCLEVQQATGETVVPANYNCPGQLVISGSTRGVDLACVALKEAGAKRALVLPVGGAFHSPLMEPARKELQEAIEATNFYTPSCAIYQNVAGKGIINRDEVKQNLIDQLTGAVKWTQCVQAMIEDGAARFTEVGPGKVLQGLIQKISGDVLVDGVN
jgi:[acyl-carrier-protein] S-malonyltransferase